MAPALGGQASGLQVACQIANADISPQISIADYADAQWHHGGARAVFISAKRRGNAQAAPDPISAVVAVCPNNPQNVAANLVCAAGQPAVSVPAGHLTITAADVNHSVEFATSSPNLQGIFIAPGTFIKCVAAACVPALPAGQVQLSKPVLDNRSLSAPLCTNVNSVGKGCLPVQPNWGLCTNNVNPCFTPPQKVLVSNDTGRAVTDGTTTAGSLCIGSVGANFKAGDIGMGISGGDIPDSAVIDSIANVPPKVPVCGANQAHILCTGCAPGAPLTTANAQVITLSPSNAPSSSRYVTNANCTAGTRTLTNGGPAFAPSDVGLPVTFVPAIPALAGARIATIGANGATAGLGAGQTGAVLNNCPAGANKVVIGLATKTAPATGDSVATLAIVLNVDPGVSPTSPPCAANKTSGFQIPLSWRNPEGTPPTPVPPAPNVLATAGYNTSVGWNSAQRREPGALQHRAAGLQDGVDVVLRLRAADLHEPW